STTTYAGGGPFGFCPALEIVSWLGFWANAMDIQNVANKKNSKRVITRLYTKTNLYFRVCCN
ncbi:MAG: hypothetical protein P8X88_09935, partial [Gammaproteobacteria bacterium]